jgi:hypothetical protein
MLVGLAAMSSKQATGLFWLHRHEGIFKMKKLVLCYLAILAVLDLCWALLVSNFGAALISAFGSIGNVSSQNTAQLSHLGGVALFFIGLFQSFVFDFIGTIALIMAFILYSTFFARK